LLLIRFLFGFAAAVAITFYTSIPTLDKSASTTRMRLNKISSHYYSKQLTKSNRYLHNDDASTIKEVDEELLNGTSTEWILLNNKASIGIRNSSSSTIPRVINKVFLKRDGKVGSPIEDFCKLQINALESWTRRNPGYSMNIFGLNDCKAYLRENFHPVFLNALNCINAYAGKANLCRAAIIFHEGGWYSDWMEEVKVDALLDTLAEGNPSLIFSWAQTRRYESETGAIMNGFFGAWPRHPMLAETLKTIVQNVNKRHYGQYPQENTGQGCMGSSFKKYYKNSNQASTKESTDFPFVAGHFSHNKNRAVSDYVFPQFRQGINIIDHMGGRCGEQKWSPENGHNKYRDLHRKREYYCTSAKFSLN